jgi:hypothetical protein
MGNSRPEVMGWWTPGVLGVAGINLLLTLVVQQGCLQDFQNSGDEYAYLLSAKLFSRGRLSTTPPQPPEAFTPLHVLPGKAFTGKYPPGWPLLLSVGLLVGLPFLVNPLLSAATVVVIGRMAREHLSPAAASRTILLLLANPFLLFTSASYFSHTAGLFFLSAAAWACLAWRRNDDSRSESTFLLAGGAFLGAAFLVRPLTATAIGIPLAFMVGRDILRHRPRSRWLSDILWISTPVLAAVGVLLCYNALVTGDPFLQPFTVYDPNDRLGPGPGAEDWAWGWRHNVLIRGLQLGLWIPLAPLLVIFVAARRQTEPGPAVWLIAIVATLGLVYAAYLRDPGNQYGPRYLYESAFAIFLLEGMALAALGRSGARIAILLVAANLGVVGWKGVQHRREIHHRTEPFRLARQMHLHDALVFLRTGSGEMEPKDLLRNGVGFDGPVLYALDLGPRNREVLRLHPHRACYLFEYDPLQESGRLTAYDPEVEQPEEAHGLERTTRLSPRRP